MNNEYELTAMDQVLALSACLESGTIEQSVDKMFWIDEPERKAAIIAYAKSNEREHIKGQRGTVTVRVSIETKDQLKLLADVIGGKTLNETIQFLISNQVNAQEDRVANLVDQATELQRIATDLKATAVSMQMDK